MEVSDVGSSAAAETAPASTPAEESKEPTAINAD